MSRIIQDGLQPEAINWSIARNLLINLSRSGPFLAKDRFAVKIIDAVFKVTLVNNFLIASAPISISIEVVSSFA
jgi:hypothetical protein